MMNKYEEALKIICDYTEYLYISRGVGRKHLLEQIKVMRELVHKATPKKPIFPSENYFFLWKCPSCNQDFISDSANNHCSNCGQALDWD